MIIGYARTSTADQIAGFDHQLDQLKKAGCEKIFAEQVSSVAERDELERALNFVREGDTFMVTKLDRLARSMKNLLEICELLERRRVTLRILDMNLDTSTPTGRLMLNLLGSIAEFERAIMLERQREGIARARACGKFKGRPKIVEKLLPEIQGLRANGVKPQEIARRLNISRISVYRGFRELDKMTGS